MYIDQIKKRKCMGEGGGGFIVTFIVRSPLCIDQIKEERYGG